MKKTLPISILGKSIGLWKQLALGLTFCGMSLGIQVLAQSTGSSCSVNAGGNSTICGTSFTLQGSSSESQTQPTWTLTSKPNGADDPVISDVHSYTPTVSGMTKPGNYTFTITQTCTSGSTISSSVTITAPGDASSFTAGPDITTIPATTGIATLNAIIPEGYTASWSYYNIFSNEYFGNTVTDNATMNNTTTATPTLTLTNKVNHTIDPSYYAVVKITANNNAYCTYTDQATVRFIPNPQLQYPLNYSDCIDPNVSDPTFIYPTSGSPIFATVTANASGNPSFGTTITMNVISQPAGSNIAFQKIISGGVLVFTGATTPGTYKFTLTISNSAGTYTTDEITYINNGIKPNQVSFVDAAYPEQMQLYTPGGSGGQVYCNKAGSTDPITFYFKVDPTNDPSTITTTVSNGGIIPTGGAPTISPVTGGGTANRSVTLTPPAAGWHVGTYKFDLGISSNGSCNITQNFYVHISDGKRPAVSVPNITVCYPGSGTVSAVVTLPAIYKGVVDPSYFQEFNGGYELSVVSKPSGSGNPTFQTSDLRSMTSTSTTISNLTMPGDYVFKIKAVPISGGIGQFLDKEYACSGTAMESTFTVSVSTQINANAGSDQTINSTVATANLVGNNPGSGASGVWSIVDAPSSTTPIITTPGNYATSVSNFDAAGTYEFAWTITTLSNGCVSTDNVLLIRPYALPVTLADFTASTQNSNVVLNWTTASEINNKGFNVLRSTDSKSFTSIGFVGTQALNGNSTKALDYIFVDKYPILDVINYYQLEQIDYDGRTDPSKKIVAVSVGKQSTVKLFPNPAHGSATLIGVFIGSDISIISMEGKVVKRFKAGGSTEQIDLSGIIPGMYILKMKGADQTERTIKFIVR